MTSTLFNLRPAEPNDANFIINSWLKRYRDAVSKKLVTDKVFYATQHDIIYKILQRPELYATVACSKDDENHIYGYCISEDLTKLVPDLVILHWCYVKGPVRRFGIAKALIADAVKEHKLVHFTHKTHLIEFLNPLKTWVHNPSYIWSLLT